jgi:hypothetical protein
MSPDGEDGRVNGVQRARGRIAVESLVLVAALVGFGIAFPPWGYVAVAAAWMAVMLVRLMRAAR